MEMETNKGEELAKVIWYYNIPIIGTINKKAICPFHKDQNPSMKLNFQDGSWYCFGCNLSGGPEKFVRLMELKYHNMNDLQSYKKYLSILKSKKCSDIKIKYISSGTPRGLSRDLYNEAYDYYHGLSKTDWRDPQKSEEISAKLYMLDRGFNSGTLNKCKAKVTYNNNYGLIFPMLDNGVFKGWVCRTMDKEIEKKRKYLYNQGFSRATTLVGDYGSKNYVFVVEGYMDRLKFIQYGVDNVVAILGWKMSDNQIQKLKSKGITKIICALDNDECGGKGYQYLKQFFNVTRFKYLKGIKDPGEMSEELFKKMYNKTMQNFSGGTKNV